jgi:GrpB-like predicted nucleotidyltransferase (UPF0157 family)
MSNQTDKPMQSIYIAPYDPEWPKIFAQQAALIKTALGNNCIEVHHIGSTSVPGLAAKPKIDILAVVHNLEQINNAALEQLDFINGGEGIPSGRYFSKKTPYNIHVHIFAVNNQKIADFLNFRDWLCMHPEDARNYEAVKKQLATIHTDGLAIRISKD